MLRSSKLEYTKFWPTLVEKGISDSVGSNSQWALCFGNGGVMFNDWSCGERAPVPKDIHKDNNPRLEKIQYFRVLESPKQVVVKREIFYQISLLLNLCC